jgi:hypothetical protein
MLDAIATEFSAAQMTSALGAALMLWWCVTVTSWPTRATLQCLLTRIGAALIAWTIAAILLLLTQLVPVPTRTTLRLLLASCILVAPLAALIVAWLQAPPGHDLRKPRWPIVIAVGFSIAVVLPLSTSAQSAPDLIVTIRELAGAPLAGISVQVHASAGGPVLAQAVTDVQGQAEIGGLSTDRVRVTIAGTLPDGTRLVQPGQDTQGIAVLLGPPPTRLDLRVAPDGTVLPDPSTMIDPIPNGPPVATPADEAGHDGRIIFPTSATLRPGSPIAVAQGGQTMPDAPTAAPPSDITDAVLATRATPAPLIWLGWVVLGSVVVVGLLVRWSVRRRRF